MMSGEKGEHEITPTGSQNIGTVGYFSHGSREIPETSAAPMATDRSEQARCRTSDVHVSGKSDSVVVPQKRANKAGHPTAAESVEGRTLTKENARQLLPDGTQSPNTNAQAFRPGSRGLSGVRAAARTDKKVKFTNLFSHLTVQLLRASFFALKKTAASGVDEQTWHDYAEGFDQRIIDLHGRIHRGAYRAKPSKRTYIPKGDGKMRPLGIAALEDKIVQQAACKVLECIYEEDFIGFSYGFRPGRSQHKALDALSVGIESQQVNWILDADIRGFFDNISHEWLMKFLAHRIADPRMLKLLKKWLRAGVSEDGTWSPTTVGTPQGAVISPLLANVFLHYVLDQWIVAWRKRARGKVIIVRYADDFVIGFREETDARQCLADLQERFTKFGLELHPEKTRLIEFGRHAESNRKQRGDGPPETFVFLGFTHICSKTRKGGFKILRKTARKKFQAKLAEVKQKLTKHLHADLSQVGAWLNSVVRGWYQYYAVPGNFHVLQQFRQTILKEWHKTLRRRSQRGRRMSWAAFSKTCLGWLPSPKILHPYPNVRFAWQHPK